MRATTRFPLRRLLLGSALLMAGCGLDLGLGTGGGAAAGNGSSLGDGVGAATAPYLVLDLATGAVVSSTDLGDQSAVQYRGTKMAFRRVSGSGDDVFVGIFEVTQDQWTRLAGTTPWTAAAVDLPWAAAAVAAGKPAFNIPYDTLTAAVSAYNAAKGAKLGLLTDAQWTFACSGGRSTTWAWGDTAGTTNELVDRARVRESLKGTSGPLAVGGTQGNRFGLYDMHGNVWEWTSPGIHVRGGSWHDPAWAARSANLAGSDDYAGLDTSIDHALIGVRLTIRP